LGPCLAPLLSALCRSPREGVQGRDPNKNFGVSEGEGGRRRVANTANTEVYFTVRYALYC